MSKFTRFLAVAALVAAPTAVAAPSASAQTSPPYYQQKPSAIEAARNVRSDAVSAVKKLSARDLVRGTKSLKLDTTNNGPGKYEIKITRKVGGKTVTIASGTKTVKTTGRKTATLKLKVTTQGKSILRRLRASKIKLSLSASFKPNGQKKKTSTQSFNLDRN